LLAALAIFPRACRVVELPLARGYREIVWRAAWPAVIPTLLLAATSHLVPGRMLFILGHMGLGALVYAALFVAFAMDRDERQWIAAAVSQLRQRRDTALAAA
jgi:hypothetical protein